MSDIGSGKTKARELQDIWMSMVQMKRLNPEIAYRIEKLVHRIAPLADKVFLKTEKARLLLVECRGKTVALQNQIESGGNDAFYVLTTLEKTFEYLLTKTYEFRIKAG
ncbi:MAG: hypothetical protein HN366_06555 [Deltaproteobacteria bacterium]|nr:hypothetical protein [Deltaproteobacteria bacterium]